MKKWLVLGILLRVVIACITYHPDTHFFVMSNYLVNTRGLVLGFYDFLGSSSEPIANIQPPSAFTYPPLGILISSLETFLPYQLLGRSFIENWLIHPHDSWSDPRIYLLILITKLAYLIPDLLAGFLLYKIFSSRVSIWKLWMINPLVLYATYAIGQFDIWPTMLVILAYYLWQQGKFSLSALTLGLGGGFKLFPLLILPVLLFSPKLKLSTRFKLGALGFLGYLVPIIPYLLTSPGFRNFALLAPQTDKILFARINLTGAEYVSIFFLAYFLIVFLSSFYKLKLSSTITAILLVFFAFTQYHPQWMIWLSPWMIVTLYRYPQTKPWWLFWGVTYIIIIFSFDASLNWGIITAFHQLPDPMSFIPVKFEPIKYLSIIRSLQAALALILITILFRQPPDSKKTSL